jgi:hypothetical protein
LIPKPIIDSQEGNRKEKRGERREERTKEEREKVKSKKVGRWEGKKVGIS